MKFLLPEFLIWIVAVLVEGKMKHTGNKTKTKVKHTPYFNHSRDHRNQTDALYHYNMSAIIIFEYPKGCGFSVLIKKRIFDKVQNMILNDTDLDWINKKNNIVDITFTFNESTWNKERLNAYPSEFNVYLWMNSSSGNSNETWIATSMESSKEYSECLFNGNSCKRWVDRIKEGISGVLRERIINTNDMRLGRRGKDVKKRDDDHDLNNIESEMLGLDWGREGNKV